MCTDQPIKDIERMIAVGTPLIAVNSYDHPHTTGRLVAMLSSKDRPVLLYNMADGFVPQNDLGKAALAAVDQNELKAAMQVGPHGALRLSLKFIQGTVILFDNLHWFWAKPAVDQTLLNLREPFKSSKRTLIGLILNAQLPNDLMQSMSFVDDPLPNEELLADKVKSICRSTVGGVADDEATEIARDLRGTSPFRAEQLAAQSLTKNGIDRKRLREQAKKQLNDTPGITVESSGETFNDVGGLTAIRDYLRKLFDGPCKPTIIVRIEEVEKAMAGAVSGESSGTGADALGELLTKMEDYKWDGFMAYGVSGCGKSLIAKAIGNEYGCRAIRFDINACLNKFVGESGRQIRQVMEMLYAIAGERVFFVASMNKIASLPPEFVRRFTAGTWYFDIPTNAARVDIWKIEAKHFGVEWDGYDCENLTGSDIRDIVRQQFKLNCTTTEAAGFHIPLCRRTPDAISQSRADATGRYLDANVGGPYGMSTTVGKGYERSIEIS